VANSIEVKSEASMIDPQAVARPNFSR
jgi:hypothetical protein